MTAKPTETILKWHGDESVIEAQIDQGRVTIRNKQMFNIDCNIAGIEPGPYFGQVRGIVENTCDIPKIARRLRLKKTDIPEVEVINPYCESNNLKEADNNSFRLIVWIGKKNREFDENLEDEGSYFVVSPLLLVSELSIFNVAKPTDNKQGPKISESISTTRYTREVKIA
ncbi:MAG: hypothetical protein PHR00_02525 [Patescibacteria group bacterium]|nr:hypothetical protein [Patescibacteria group bacterium]